MSDTECKECGSTGWVTAQEGGDISMRPCPCRSGAPEESVKAKGFHLTVGVEATPTTPGWTKTLMGEQNGQVFINSLSQEQIHSLLNASGGLKSWQHFVHIFSIHFINALALETGALKARVELLEKGAKLAEERQALTDKRLSDNDELRKRLHDAVDALSNKISVVESSLVRATTSVLDLSNSVIKFLTGAR